MNFSCTKELKPRTKAADYPIFKTLLLDITVCAMHQKSKIA